MRRLVRALLKAERYIRSRPSQAQAQVAKHLKVPVDALQAAWSDLDFQVDLRQSQLITLEDEARWAMARGYVPARTMPNFLPHFYLDALLAEQPERVTVIR